ncbi:MAG: methyltransferase domain-containing protein [Caulobacteraceae bacterium]|nr:methyltransferase domain-containing protein [Caulobacteraceae bacterium]
MRKLNLGCGGNILQGWENHDIDIDITKPLPYEDNTIDLIFAEHVVEHTDSPTALRFFDECFRILKKGGVARIAVPSVSRIFLYADKEYLEWLCKSGLGQPTMNSAIRNIVLNHGHKSCWTGEILHALLFAAGFENIEPHFAGHSLRHELNDIEGHGKVIGDHNNKIETIIMEAVK